MCCLEKGAANSVVQKATEKTALVVVLQKSDRQNFTLKPAASKCACLALAGC